MVKMSKSYGVFASKEREMCFLFLCFLALEPSFGLTYHAMVSCVLEEASDFPKDFIALLLCDFLNNTILHK